METRELGVYRIGRNGSWKRDVREVDRCIDARIKRRFANEVARKRQTERERRVSRSRWDPLAPKGVVPRSEKGGKMKEALHSFVRRWRAIPSNPSSSLFGTEPAASSLHGGRARIKEGLSRRRKEKEEVRNVNQCFWPISPAETSQIPPRFEDRFVPSFLPANSRAFDRRYTLYHRMFEQFNFNFPRTE